VTGHEIVPTSREAATDRAMSFARRDRHSNMAEAITHLIAAVPVSDLDASIDWYTRLLGRLPDLRVGSEVLRDIATLFIEPNAVTAGAGRVTPRTSRIARGLNAAWRASTSANLAAAEGGRWSTAGQHG
jgi:hypothetical protein